MGEKEAVRRDTQGDLEGWWNLHIISGTTLVQTRPAGKQPVHPICVYFGFCSGNAKPEGSPILPHEPVKIKQDEGKDLTRPSRPAVSFKSLLWQNAGNALFVWEATSPLSLNKWKESVLLFIYHSSVLCVERDYKKKEVFREIDGLRLL